MSNYIADEIMSHYGDSERFLSNPDTQRVLAHYGTKYHSGRYPWGSGEDPYQHDGLHSSKPDKAHLMDGAVEWNNNVDKMMQQKNFTYTDPVTKEKLTGEIAIAKACGFDSTTEFRTAKRIANDYSRSLQIAEAERLRKEGLSYDKIAAQMGLPGDSSVRSLLNAASKSNTDQARVTANEIKKIVEDLNKNSSEPQLLDVGTGIEQNLGISKTKLDSALYILQAEEGYVVGGAGIQQQTNKGKQTNVKVIGPAGTTQKDIFNFKNLHFDLSNITSYDNGETYHKAFEYPTSLDSKRLQIVYAEDGGTQKDGLIEVRPGVKDLSLDGSLYCQARIMVDNSLYLKGMCVYSNDLPDGVDVRFNTNKSNSKPLDKVLKKLKKTYATNEDGSLKLDENGNKIEIIDRDNPFGSLIKENRGQNYYTDDDGTQKLGLVNKRAEEGDWYEWSDSLPSQFVSKQNIKLINQLISKTETQLNDELNEINQITNPTIRKKYLLDFAQSCDKQAVELKVTSLPRQKYQVILPSSTLKDDEIYAPNYEDGEKVALIRYPHASTCEIPVLTVNNKNKECISMIGKNPKDAVCINHNVAEQLSGADFDGDTVQVIPTRGNGKNLDVDISHQARFKDLEGFDDKEAYPKVEGMTLMKYTKSNGSTVDNTGSEMGKITNLITDMTLAGASEDELVRAIKHSMVIVDAAKHELNYKQSYIDNGIRELKIKYQGVVNPETGKINTPSATIISRAKAQTTVPRTKGSPTYNADGTITYKMADTYIDYKTGEVKNHMVESTQMAETDDAFTLVRDPNNEKEVAYANYANTLKGLAIEARKQYVATEEMDYNPQAAAIYADEVKSIDNKIKVAQSNAPKERAAQTIAGTRAKEKISLYGLSESTDGKEIRKIQQQQLTKARAEVGAKRQSFGITDSEWEAIQAGAISKTKLSELMRYVDNDDLRARSMPKEGNALSDRQIQKIEQMMKSGKYTTSQIASALGVSVSSVMKYQNGAV